MNISSPAFKNGEKIPNKYTCEGVDINPELNIDHIPSGTKSLVLIVDDPDAPNGTWTHWIVYDIPSDTTKIPENSTVGKAGVSTANKKSYMGPCPPSKETHRYYYTLYALDTRIELSEGITRELLDKKIKSHILERAQIMGYFSRN